VTNLSVGCRRELKADPRANALYGTMGMTHVCSGECIADGKAVPCECLCHAHAKGTN